MRRSWAFLLATIVLAITGCSVGTSNAEDHGTTEPRADTTLTVLAAASLQPSFEELSEEFTAQHPDVTVAFNFAGSSTLVHQLETGFPADVLATADEPNMDEAAEANLIDLDTRVLFTSNRLVGVVPADNPAGISSLTDASAADVKLVTCAPQVPCGALAQTIAEDAGITLNPVSEEQQVSDVLGKVRSGQADAGLVYATDAALAAEEVHTFEIEGAHDELNNYPIARTTHAEHAEAADAFIEFVRSDSGQSILQSHGFAQP